MPLAIQIEQLTKDFAIGFWRRQSRHVLDGLTLHVARGEIFGFRGPTGAGKTTTTLKLLNGLLFPTSGRALILGRPAGDVELRRRIGFLPEQPCFYDYLTAEELLEYFAGLFGYGRPARRERTARVLDEVGIGKERRLPLRKPSKGMLQRVGIAQALLNQPEVVFPDEYLRRIAEYRLVQLRVLDEIDSLNARLARVRQETGRLATSWAPLAARGWLPRDPPLDPAGAPYVLDPITGLAMVSERSPYYPLPIDTTLSPLPPRLPS